MAYPGCTIYLVGGDNLFECSDEFERIVNQSNADADTERRPPTVRIAGHCSWWLSTRDGEFHRDALFAVTTGTAGEKKLADMGLRPKFVAEVVGEPLDQVLDLLSTVTGAALALVTVGKSAASRPPHARRDIATCREWLDRPFRQYLTGRGAQRGVVGPWTRFIEDHEALLARVERSWNEEVLPREASLPDNHPLQQLLAPLSLAVVERDRVDILKEYGDRLSSLNRECNRVANEIGIVGVLVSLALMPIANVLGWLILVVVLLIGVLYYGGYGMAKALGNLRLPQSSTGLLPFRSAASPSLIDVIKDLPSRPVRILAGRRMALADIGACFWLWFNLMQRSRADAVLEAVELTAADADDGRTRIVVGGPLVRAPCIGQASSAHAACDLTDAAGLGWRFQAGNETVVKASENEQVGCVSLAVDRDDVLFVVGIRDVGTLAAVEWLTRQVDSSSGRHVPSGWGPSWHLEEGSPQSQRAMRSRLGGTLRFLPWSDTKRDIGASVGG